VVATGFDLFPQTRLPEYGGGQVPDVIDALAFERLLAASGPTGGKVKRPSDGQEPREVVFVQCAGSRDPEHGMPYCSKICCMYTAKQAILYKHRVHHGQPYIFYIDIRAGGKGYEEFINRAQQDEGVMYLRGKVSKIYRDGDKVMVWGSDTLSGRKVEIAADLVVLSVAAIPALPGTDGPAGRLYGIPGLELALDADGFYQPAIRNSRRSRATCPACSWRARVLARRTFQRRSLRRAAQQPKCSPCSGAHRNSTHRKLCSPKLFIPGPCDVDDDVLDAMRQQVQRSHGAEWLSIYAETLGLLKQVFQTQNDIFIVPGPGSAGLDMALGSLLTTGDKVIVAHNGFFGERLGSIAESNGFHIVHVTAPAGRPLDPDDLRRALIEHPDAMLVALVHHETTTTVANPLPRAGAGNARSGPRDSR